MTLSVSVPGPRFGRRPRRALHSGALAIGLCVAPGAQAVQRARSRIQSEPSIPCGQILREWLSMLKDSQVSVGELPSEREARLAVQAQEAGSHPTPPVRAGSDPRLPSFEPIEQTAALIRVRSFDLRYRDAVQELVQKNRAQFAQRRDLVLDLRGNGGGGDATYQVLGELVYTQPVLVVGNDILSSPQIIASWERILPEVPADLRPQFETLVAQLRAHPGEFSSMGPDDLITHQVSGPTPERIAVLIDDRCASSCEQFLLEARASGKLRIYGSSSRGVLDYSNVVEHALPSGRELRLPTSRSRRLPAAPVDGVGIPPDVAMDPALFDGPQRSAVLQRVLADLRRSLAL